MIKDEARQDPSDAYWYYEEKQEELGERFLSEVQKGLEDLRQYPEYYSFI